VHSLLLIPLLLVTIDEIHIHERWTGLGDPRELDYIVSRRDAGFETLEEVIRSAPVSRDDALRTLADAKWLRAHAGEAYEESRPDHKHAAACSDKARQIFTDRFTDTKVAIAALGEHYGSMWTDDVPSIAIDITLHDRRHVQLTSDSQHVFMLPWRVDGVPTWNPRIPRAVAVLLRDDSIVGSRFAERQLAAAIGEEMFEALGDPIAEAEQRCRFKDVLAALNRHFEIVDAYGRTAASFDGHLRRDDFPPNLTVSAHIAAGTPPEQQQQVDTLITKIGGYLELVRPFVEARPQSTFEIAYADGQSAGEFTLDFDEHPEAIERVRRNQEHAAVVLERTATSTATWVILPGGEAIQW